MKFLQILQQIVTSIIFWGRMKYPEALLPRMPFENIKSDLPEFYICRTTPDKNNLKNSSGKPTDSALFKEQGEFFDYSTNLLGNFLIEHNYIQIHGNERKYFYSD